MVQLGRDITEFRAPRLTLIMRPRPGPQPRVRSAGQRGSSSPSSCGSCGVWLTRTFVRIIERPCDIAGRGSDNRLILALLTCDLHKITYASHGFMSEQDVSFAQREDRGNEQVPYDAGGRRFQVGSPGCSTRPRGSTVSESIVFVHLSDIHFRSRRGDDVWDLDRELRNELERDLRELKQDLGQVSGILVTGDIAYSGTPEEYERAAGWLTTLCGILGCPEEDVWTVPGNHDVDRSVVRASRTLQMYHDKLRTCSEAEINPLLHELLVEDPTATEALFRPLESYNRFAAKYECSVNGDRPFWEGDLTLGGGLTLRMRGLTSTIVSDALDDAGAHKLVLGGAQSMLMRQDDIVYLTLCHHPPTWLRDGDEVVAALRSAALVQLWGHKHVQRAEQVDNTVQITAGAVHPERAGRQWEPRYNVVTLRAVEGSGQGASIAVTLLPRVWRTENRRFGADFDQKGNRSRSYVLPLQDRPARPPDLPVPPPVPVNAPADQYETPPTVVTQGGGERIVNRTRRLAFRYSSLPYQVRLEVARALELIDEDERMLPDRELFHRILARAVEGQLLDRLWDEIERRHPEPSGIPNPFRQE